MDYGPSLLEQCVGSLPQNYLQISVGEPTQGPRGTFESGGGGGGGWNSVLVRITEV